MEIVFVVDLWWPYMRGCWERGMGILPPDHPEPLPTPLNPQP